MTLRFDGHEVRDLLAAWLALGFAFTVFVEREFTALIAGRPTDLTAGALATTLVVSLVTVGVGFLLHELAHKVVAVHFGQVAAFRADYSWLFLAIMGGLIGFLFAAPGAVYHRGTVTDRQRGLISVAGPVTNLVLAAGFFLFGMAVTAWGGGPTLASVASLGTSINLLLAGFNMIPIGALDGRKVLGWSPVAWLFVAIPSIGLGVWALFEGFGGI